MGRYCSDLLPKPTRGTIKILRFKTMRMIGRPALYSMFVGINLKYHLGI